MTPPPRPNSLLVLGCGVNPAGELDEAARTSMRLAATYFQQHDIDWLLCSGNYSYKVDNPPKRSEAAALRAYALECGVPDICILTENQSFDTFSNILFVAQTLLQQHHIKHVTVWGGPNHTKAKLAYICGKIWATQPTWAILDHFADTPGEAVREAVSLRRLRQLFDDVPDGQLPALHSALRARHPAFKTDRRRGV